MEKSRIWAGALIMIGLIVLGCKLPSAVKTFKSFDRTVSVKGLCEKEVNADKVIWPISFVVAGNEINAVYSEVESSTKQIKDFLLSGGISEDEISVSAPSISDKFAQEYGNNDRLYRYVCKNVITVCSKNVDTVNSLIAKQGTLLKKGILISENSWENKITYSFEGLNEIKPEMIEVATKNAREVARKFAADSDSKLGKIKDASQGTFSIEDRDSNTPYIKKVRVVTYITYYLKQ